MNSIGILFLISLPFVILMLILMMNVGSNGKKIEKLEKRFKNMEVILNQVAEKLELPELEVNARLRLLLKEGKDIEAVRVAREELGLSLLEGKNYVDNLKNEKGKEEI